MTDLLPALTWPEAVAIVGSVIAIMTGIVALVTNYIRTPKSGPNTKQEPSPVSAEQEHVHEQLADLRDRVSNMEGDWKVLRTQLENVIRQLNDHEHRDMEDFKGLSRKIDKLMEIIVEVLKDDHE